MTPEQHRQINTARAVAKFLDAHANTSSRFDDPAGYKFYDSLAMQCLDRADLLESESKGELRHRTG